MTGQVWGALTAALTLIGSYLVARLGARAEQRKAELAAKIDERRATDEGEVAAGQLALEVAQEARDTANEIRQEMRALNRWRRAVERWWPEHSGFDAAVLKELERLDPSAVAHLTPPAPMPTFEDEPTTRRQRGQ